MDKKHWKEVLISVFVGAIVAFLTTLMQGFLDILQNIPEEPVSAGVGMLTYIKRIFI